jgi:hypothetical protein
MAKPKVKTIRGKNPVGLQRAFDDPILVEGHADPFLLPPDDMTGDVRVVRLKDKIEALGDVVGARNLDRRTRNGNVADQAVDHAASELNRSRHQYRLARGRAFFHDTLMPRTP